METINGKVYLTSAEASAVMSVQRGYFVSYDAFKQAASARMSKESIIKKGYRETYYEKEAVKSLPYRYVPHTANNEHPPQITVEQMADWMIHYPQLLAELEEEGYPIPRKGEIVERLTGKPGKSKRRQKQKQQVS